MQPSADPTVIYNPTPPPGAQGGGAVFVWLFVGIAIIVGIRLLAGHWDRERIKADLVRRGARVDEIAWSPFGKGWFGEKGDRIYRVSFIPAAGPHRTAWCKTSMWSGVFWSDETDVFGVPESSPREASDENARLRAENERLRQELEATESHASEKDPNRV